MKTDELVSMLAMRVEPVDARAPLRRSAVALGAGLVVAAALMTVWLGVRPTLADDRYLPMFWGKALFCLALAAIGLAAAKRLARPGGALAIISALLPLPFLALWGVGSVEWLAAAPQDRSALVLGISWKECSFNIAVVAMPIFIAVIWATKGMAPTRLRMAGAAAGFASGAMGALIYTLHCPELAAPFLGVWYVLGILTPTMLGTWLGPRLLRW